MDFETYFNLVFILVAVYVSLGNYLYFKKVIPALNAAPAVSPSIQFKHMQLYVNLLQEKGEKPWFFFYLKNIKIITVGIALLMVAIFVHVLGLI